MQGHLRDEFLTVTTTSSCAHCDETISISVDSDLNIQTAPGAENTLVFEPQVAINPATFSEPNIINAYCRNCVFFCSEVHAQAYREANDQVGGAYYTLVQHAAKTRFVHAALFGFSQ